MANQTGWVMTSTPRQEVIDGADFCDHVSAEDMCKAVGYGYESDSCGLVAAYICCQECCDAARKQEQEELVTCNDCGQRHPRKNVTAWKWYDFYAAQGDEPIEVCNGCWDQPKHQQRLKKDAQDYAEEFGVEDDLDDDEDDGDDDWHLDQDVLDNNEAVAQEELERSLREED